MAAVDETSGTITQRDERALGDVATGYTAFQDGDVLFAKITPCMQNGKSAVARDLVNGIGRGSTEFYILRPGERILADYVHHFVRQKTFRDAAMRSFTGTAGQQRVPRSFMERAEIPLPPFDEQRRIVDILNCAASIERLRARASSHLRDLIPALFIKMFGDPIDNPMGWDVKPLGDYIVDGPQNGLYRPKTDYGAGTRILRIDGFYDGETIEQERWQRLHIADADAARYALHKDDIVINRVNSRPYLGKSTIIPKLAEPAVFESNMMRLGVDRTRLLPHFLIEQLQLAPMRDRLRANAKDAINQASINQTDVQTLRVLVPPPELQKRFAAQVSRAKGCATIGTSAAIAARELSAGLMGRLLHSDGCTSANKRVEVPAA